MTKASEIAQAAKGFYLTDEECKCKGRFVTFDFSSCFYLTDEECKVVFIHQNEILLALKFLSN